ncbi:ASPIC and UnbV [Maioricimonas rarisocia]|uniref:ASPIC and UnbV n=1 Tax=Maioricimonas rarisocia TaxID=2528026 RepID=A0A517Z1Q5_9PLAN|nr:FG-GAP-like repeat-containing protein [Maioricimonas rarisocia]QDU36339.1 ASPIC and UnbV [Maioricimonas rarisocia]
MSSRPSPRGSIRFLLVGGAVLAVGLLGLAFWPSDSKPEPVPQDALLERAEAALQSREYDRVLQLTRDVDPASDEWPRARMLAGEAATRSGQLQQALEEYGALAEQRPDTTEAAEARFYSGEVYRELGQLSQAVDAYRQAVMIAPDNVAIHERLAFLLSTVGNRWEAYRHYGVLVRSGSATYVELALFADLERPVEQRPFLEECARKAPDDVLVRQGLAAHTLWEGKADAAERQLRDLLEDRPDLPAAQAMLGELLVKGEAGPFLRWHSDVPAEATGHPDVWYVRGLWLRRQGDLRGAAHCLLTTLQLAPTLRRATVQLGQVLTSLEEPEAEAVAEYADRLVQLTQTIDAILRTEAEKEDVLRQAVDLLVRTGRIWEACAWGVVARGRFPEAAWPEELFERWSGLLNPQLPVVLEQAGPLSVFDVAEFPLADTLFRLPDSSPESASRSEGTAAKIRFEEADAGIDFVYFNGNEFFDHRFDRPAGTSEQQPRGNRQFEQTGGGVGVIDYDLDGAPDLYLTQGTTWEMGEQEPGPTPEFTDQLFRGYGPDGFATVTANARVRGVGFGQGCTVGDFNNDGFPDLYVANVGRNRLLENMGDGTFVDVTDEAGLRHDEWTTSVLLADLNGDGVPDLFDVNYVRGPQVFTAICDGRACSPSVFDGCPDRVLLGRGDGTFAAASIEAESDNSKGLGIVTLFPREQSLPSLFIANDQTANFFLQPPREAGEPFALTDAAFLTGLAFDVNGTALACMGIAADDIDGNGTTDLFVTNFRDESNTLYLQDPPGLFLDATTAMGLHSASVPYVGWGTQFLDADLDGDPDVVLVNGHVDDYRDEGGEYHMRPQFFRNRGDGRFDEMDAADVGSWFSRKFLGRGLARLDWNRDGRMDFAVSNIGDRASLMTNASESVGHFLNIRLHATATARDAFGTRVTVTAGDEERTRTLLAGDGYMASNERVLQFGLGAAESADIRIEWPSGSVTPLEDLPVDVTVELVEGRAVGILWRGAEPEPLPVPAETIPVP